MEDNLYPIMFKGKLWKEEECDDVFVAFFHSRMNLAPDCSVYVSEGDRVQPDGTWV